MLTMLSYFFVWIQNCKTNETIVEYFSKVSSDFTSIVSSRFPQVCHKWQNPLLFIGQILLYSYAYIHLYAHVCIHSLTDEHLVSLHILAIMKNAAVNQHGVVEITLKTFFKSCKYRLRSGIVEQYGIFLFSFEEMLYSLKYNLHSHPQCAMFNFSLCPHQYLSFIFLIISIL